ncbi:transposase, partial [Pseudomonas amygdali pv. aesculi]
QRLPRWGCGADTLFLAITEALKNWKAVHHWKSALQSFQVMFGEERMTMKIQIT